MHTRFAFLALFLAATPAASEKLKDIFPSAEPLCYALATPYPSKGYVESFELFRLLPGDDSEEWISPTVMEMAAINKTTSAANVDVQVRIKGDKRAYHQGLSCYEGEKGVTCGVDCDGGNFTLKRDNTTLNIGLNKDGFVINGGCGAEEDVASLNLTSFQAPKGLLLKKQDISACMTARRAHYATRLRDETSLRARIVKNGWRCLSRSYDATHMAKNPKQTVKDISVSIIKKPKRGEMKDGYAETEMRVSVKLTLKNGKTAKAEEDCNAYSDSFSCGDTFELLRRDDTSALLKLNAYDKPELKLAGLMMSSEDKVMKLEASTKACE